MIPVILFVILTACKEKVNPLESDNFANPADSIDGVQIKFINVSEYDLMDIEFFKYYKGEREPYGGCYKKFSKLNAGDSTDYITFEYFQVQDGMLRSAIYAKIAQDGGIAVPHGSCGTGIEYISDGKFEFIIRVWNVDSTFWNSEADYITSMFPERE